MEATVSERCSSELIPDHSNVLFYLVKSVFKICLARKRGDHGTNVSNFSQSPLCERCLQNATSARDWPRYRGRRGNHSRDTRTKQTVQKQKDKLPLEHALLTPLANMDVIMMSNCIKISFYRLISSTIITRLAYLCFRWIDNITFSKRKTTFFVLEKIITWHESIQATAIFDFYVYGHCHVTSKNLNNNLSLWSMPA